MPRLLLLFCFILLNLQGIAQFKHPVKKGNPARSFTKPKAPSSPSVFSNTKSISYNNFGQLNSNLIKRPLKIEARDKNNMPTFIKGNLENYSQDLQRQAKEYLEEVATSYQINDPHLEWQIKELVSDHLGMTHIKVGQVYKGIPVFNGEINLHAPNDRIQFLMGRGFPTPEVSTSPSISQAEAERLVWSHLQSLDHFVEITSEQKQFFEMEQIEVELVIYHEDGKANAELLAYHIKAYENLANLSTYFLDANTGAIIHQHSGLCKIHSSLPPDGPTTAVARDLNNINRNLNVYEVGGNFFMINAVKPNFSASQSNMPNDPKGVIWTLDAQNKSPQNDGFSPFHVANNDNVSWIDKSSVSAHYNAGIAYDYFKDVHGRNAIDGSGGNIISIVNVTDEDEKNMDNAFWNGVAMFYGNGDAAFRPLAGALDVAGHEMSHGVIQTTANLNYEGESGALNESFADIFGAMMDRDDYQIGEDVVTNVFPTGALRDLSNPNNGGTQLGQPGYQPANVSEQYFGNEDNGGVHINSGIPNFAFFKFAEAVGKDKAEQVFYRALVFYLTRSSQFADARNAVVQAAQDLYGSAEVNAANVAFDQVGIGQSEGGDYTNDAEANTGEDYVVYADNGLTKLLIIDDELNIVLDPASASAPISKPSVTDDGSLIYYVNEDNQIAVTVIDWNTGNVNAEIVQDQQIWSNVVISKDGNRMAMVESAISNRIQVYDFNKQEFYKDQFGNFGFELYNPTFTEGISTGDAKFADAMEFDISGEILMYDVYSEIASSFGETIGYWDIGFLRVFDNSTADWGDGFISKMFSNLAEGISIGNPTFARNSPYIIAFDYIEDNTYSLLGANVETGDVALIFENTSLSYPSYNAEDNQVYITRQGFFGTDVFKLNLDDSKILSISGSEDLAISNGRWAVPFRNGTRILSNINEVDVETDNLRVFPNPAVDMLTFELELDKQMSGILEVRNIEGRLIMKKSIQFQSGINQNTIDVSSFPQGNYNLILKSKEFHKVTFLTKK